MRTLCGRLDLDTDGDQVVFRRFGRESDIRTLESGHTLIRDDQLATGGWHPPPEIISRCERMADSHCSSQSSYYDQSMTIQYRLQDRPTYDDQTDDPSAVTIPTSDAQDLRTPTSRPHNRCESVKRVCFEKSTCEVAQKTKTRQWARLVRYLMFVGMAAFYDILTMELLALLPTGAKHLCANGSKERNSPPILVPRLPGHGSWNPPLAVIKNIQARNAGTRRCTTRGAKPMIEACGPVQITKGEGFYIGATRAMNNTAEMQGVIEALFWLNSCVERGTLHAGDDVLITVDLAPRQGAD